MERGILRTFKADGTPVEIYDAEALTKVEFDLLNTSSTEESDSGRKWIDGRIIYQKSFALGSFPINTDKAIPHNISNLAYVVEYNAMYYDASYGQNYPLPFVGIPTGGGVTPTAWGRVDIRGDYINLSGTNLTSTTAVAFATVYYVKDE